MVHSSRLDRLTRGAARALLAAAVLAASVAVPESGAEAQVLKKIKGKVTRATGGGESDLRSTTAAAKESTATAARDTLRKPDSAASAKSGRLGALGRAAAKANKVATAIERETGVSKETMAKAALAGTGVGAAAMLAKPGETSAKVQAAKAAGRALLSGVDAANSGSAAASAGVSVHSSSAALAMMPGAALQPGANAELVQLQQEMMQIAMRASAGDDGARRQLVRFQAEMAYAVTALATLPPDKQASASVAMQRQALRCATSGTGCKAAAP